MFVISISGSIGIYPTKVQISIRFGNIFTYILKTRRGLLPLRSKFRSMITYDSHTLANGLRVVVNRDPDSAMAAVNLLYAVGARNESPDCTGFAHLFEHLMFRGTRNVPDFDAPLQLACGENNAFTNNDYTDYYITLPKDNIETALWLESDRMRGLDISDEVLETEKRVVLEEYNQRYNLF